jgi:hypothetical protein
MNHRKSRFRVAAGMALAMLSTSPLIAVAGAQVSYVPNLELSLPPKKDIRLIDVYQIGEKNTRPSALMGHVVVEGDGKQTIEQLVSSAREKAAELGADFISIQKVSTRSKIHTDPSFAFAVPFLHGAMAVSHAGNTERQEIPAMLVIVGAYSKSTVGVKWDIDAVKQGKYIIREMDSYSPGIAAGLSIGDEVLEIDGMNPADKRVRQLHFAAMPGTKVRYHIKRGDQRLDVEMETVPPP